MTTWRRYPRFDPQNSTSLVRKLPLELSLLRDDMTTWQRHPRFDPKISTSHLGDFPLEWSLLLDDMTTWQRHPRFKFNIVCWKLSFGGCLLLDDMSTWQRHPRFDPQNSTSLVGNMIFWNGLSEKATKSCTPMPTTTFSSVGRAFEVLQKVFQGKTPLGPTKEYSKMRPKVVLRCQLQLFLGLGGILNSLRTMGGGGRWTRTVGKGRRKKKSMAT